MNMTRQLSLLLIALSFAALRADESTVSTRIFNLEETESYFKFAGPTNNFRFDITVQAGESTSITASGRKELLDSLSLTEEVPENEGPDAPTKIIAITTDYKCPKNAKTESVSVLITTPQLTLIMSQKSDVTLNLDANAPLNQENFGIFAAESNFELSAQSITSKKAGLVAMQSSGTLTINNVESEEFNVVLFSFLDNSSNCTINEANVSNEFQAHLFGNDSLVLKEGSIKTLKLDHGFDSTWETGNVAIEETIIKPIETTSE